MHVVSHAPYRLDIMCMFDVQKRTRLAAGVDCLDGDHRARPHLAVAAGRELLAGQDALLVFSKQPGHQIIRLQGGMVNKACQGLFIALGDLRSTAAELALQRKH